MVGEAPVPHIYLLLSEELETSPPLPHLLKKLKKEINKRKKLKIELAMVSGAS